MADLATWLDCVETHERAGAEGVWYVSVRDLRDLVERLRAAEAVIDAGERFASEDSDEAWGAWRATIAAYEKARS